MLGHGSGINTDRSLRFCDERCTDGLQQAARFRLVSTLSGGLAICYKHLDRALGDFSKLPYVICKLIHKTPA